MPNLRGICRTFWFAYLISYPFNAYTTYLGIAACCLTMIKYCGSPKMSLESAQTWFQTAINVDEFHVLSYMMATMMAPNGVFINGPVIITALLNAVNELKNMVVQNPDLPLLGNATVKSYLEKGSSYQVTDAAKKMRSDIEVYCGFMLIPLALVGTASWMAPLTYWQMSRMRYMISVSLQQAWMRFD